MRELLTIFLAFTKIGVLTFGGGYSMLPIIQKDLVEKRKWVTEQDVMDFFALGQCIPGIIAVNTAMFIGNKIKGKSGLIFAALGIIFPSVVIILFVAMFFNSFMQFEAVKYAFNGIRIAVAVLIVNAAVKMWKPAIVDTKCLVIFLTTLILLVMFNISPIIPVVSAAVLGILIKRSKA